MTAKTKVRVQDWDDVYDEWSLLVGRFIVSFSNVELWASQCVRAFGSGRLHKTCMEMSIEPRAKIAEGLMLRSDLSAEEKVRIEAAFAELRRLSVQRNLVAHNPPMENVYLSPEGKVTMARELRSLRNHTKIVTKRDLAALHKASVELGSELFDLMQKHAPRS